jgi:Zn-dependent protease with chaperone function
MTGSATSAPAPGQSSAERPVPAAHRVPAGTTTLFALLIAGVLATTSVVYVLLYGAVPLHHRIFLKTLRVCEAREPGLALSSDKGNNLPWEADALTRIQGCMAPVYRGEVAWAVSGVVLVFVLALLLYWVRPWWLIRRRLLKPIGDSDLKLVEDLEKWSEETGLEPPPTFLIAADDRVGAEAFGRIGRRYVQLNAALVDLRTDDEGNADVAGEAQFRAGVLHELAHLRNRDVDKTEFAYAIVTSFTIVAVLPMVWLVLRPAVLSTVVSSGPADVGLALLTLAAVVVLTGLAVRRTRELHADAQAVHHERHPKPADDLRALIERISKPADEHAGESVREFAKAHWPRCCGTGCGSCSARGSSPR